MSDDTSPWSAFLDVRGIVHDRQTTRPHPSPYVGARVAGDDDLQALLAYRGPLRVVSGRGAGQVRLIGRACVRNEVPLVALDLPVRDLDDPAGNVRRFVTAIEAARDAEELADDLTVHVGLAGEPTYGWLAAADEVAAAELALTIPLDLPGDGVRGWIDAALDRETPFSLSGGTIEQAVAALSTTARLWGDPDDLAAARRWCRSWVCDNRASEGAIAHLTSRDSSR